MKQSKSSPVDSVLTRSLVEIGKLATDVSSGYSSISSAVLLCLTSRNCLCTTGQIELRPLPDHHSLQAISHCRRYEPAYSYKYYASISNRLRLDILPLSKFVKHSVGRSRMIVERIVPVPLMISSMSPRISGIADAVIRQARLHAPESRSCFCDLKGITSCLKAISSVRAVQNTGAMSSDLRPLSFSFSFCFERSCLVWYSLILDSCDWLSCFPAKYHNPDLPQALCTSREDVHKQPQMAHI